MLRIAGVTFANENGENRQDILKAFALQGKNILTVDLKVTEYEGEKAIKCIEHKTKQMLGWIPKTDIEKVKHSQMTAFIRKSKRGYSAALDIQKKPTRNQYYYVGKLCERYGMEQPAYDIRAYAQIFEMERVAR